MYLLHLWLRPSFGPRWVLAKYMSSCSYSAVHRLAHQSLRRFCCISCANHRVACRASFVDVESTPFAPRAARVSHNRHVGVLGLKIVVQLLSARASVGAPTVQHIERRAHVPTELCLAEQGDAARAREQLLQHELSDRRWPSCFCLSGPASK